MLKIDLKKVPSPKFFLHDYVGTMTQLFTKKKSHFTIPLNYSIELYKEVNKEDVG